MSEPAAGDAQLIAVWVSLAALGLLVLVLIGTAFRYRFRNDRHRDAWNRREALWEPVVLAVLATGEGDESVHRLVAPEDRLYFVDYLLRVARRLEGDERRIVERLAAPYLELLVARYRRRDAAFRARAIRTFGGLGGERLHHLVVEALDDPSDLVAIVAARSLTQSGSPELATAVLARLPRFLAWRPSLLASMLARVGPAMGPPLRQLLADRSAGDSVRVVAAEALAELHDPFAADVAASVLGSTGDTDLLVAALGILLRLGREEHLPAIRPLVDAAAAPVRARAFAAVARLEGDLSPEQVERVLRDPSPWVPIRTVEALEEAGAGRIARLLTTRSVAERAALEPAE